MVGDTELEDQDEVANAGNIGNEDDEAGQVDGSGTHIVVAELVETNGDSQVSEVQVAGKRMGLIHNRRIHYQLHLVASLIGDQADQV